AIWAALGGSRQEDANTNLLARTRLVEPTDDLAAVLKPPKGQEAANPFRVAVLCDVKELGAAQRQALEEFVREGGGLLVVVGPRADPAHYNRYLYSKVLRQDDREIVRD